MAFEMAASILPHVATLADLVDRLGDVPLDRIRLHPPPGTATEDDLVAHVDGDDKRLCELVDGVLVDKPVGWYESALTIQLIVLLGQFVHEHNLGLVLGADGMHRLAPGLVRLPDVSFVSWDRFAGGRPPRGPFVPLGPDLAVEVLSPSNTPREMTRKLHEYFASGCRLAWYVPYGQRLVHVYTSPTEMRVLGDDDVLDGGDVVPGFTLPVHIWFDRTPTPSDL